MTQPDTAALAWGNLVKNILSECDHEQTMRKTQIMGHLTKEPAPTRQNYCHEENEETQ